MVATVTSYSADDFTQLLGLELSSTPELIGAVRRGLPYSVFERVQRTLGVSAQTLAALIGLPVRTLNKRKHEGRFSSEESDNLLRVVRVVSKTFDFFDEPEAARAWLQAPEMALGGDTPLSLLDTEMGAQEILRLLGQLEHGVLP